MSSGRKPTGERVENEFAAVDLAVVEVPWGKVLRITDARTGLEVELDALALEALTRLVEADVEALVYTSAGRLTRTGMQRNLKVVPRADA